MYLIRSFADIYLPVNNPRHLSIIPPFCRSIEDATVDIPGDHVLCFTGTSYRTIIIADRSP